MFNIPFNKERSALFLYVADGLDASLVMKIYLGETASRNAGGNVCLGLEET